MLVLGSDNQGFSAQKICRLRWPKHSDVNVSNEPRFDSARYQFQYCCKYLVATPLKRDIQSIRPCTCALACAIMLRRQVRLRIFRLASFLSVRVSKFDFSAAISDEGLRFSVMIWAISSVFFFLLSSCRQGIPRASATRMELVAGIFLSGMFLCPLYECGRRISHIPAGALLGVVAR